MNKIKTIDQLEARIAILEHKQQAEWNEMKSRVSDTYESIKPATFVRNMVGDIKDSFGSKSDILHDGAALASGMIANALTSGSKNKPMRKLISVLLFTLVTYLITKHREEIVAAGNTAFKYVSDKFQDLKEKMSGEEDD